MRSKIGSSVLASVLVVVFVGAGCEAGDKQRRTPVHSSSASTSAKPAPLARGRCVAGPAATANMTPRIAFVRDDDSANVHAIYTARPDGSDEQRVYTLPKGDESIIGRPRLSADGARIAFTLRDEEYQASKMYVIDANGGAARRVPGVTRADSDPVFSPDGHCVAYSRYGQIYTAYADGRSKPKYLTTLEVGRHDEPAWSPDGRYIAYSALHPGLAAEEDSSAILVVRADGKGAPTTRTDVPGGTLDYAPTWSPDGRTIAFVRAAACCEPQVWTVPAGGGPVSRVSPEDRVARDPTFSPDGRRIMYTGYHFDDPDRVQDGGQLDLYSSTVAGADRTRITRTTGRVNEQLPSWIGA